MDSMAIGIASGRGRCDVTRCDPRIIAAAAQLDPKESPAMSRPVIDLAFALSGVALVSVQGVNI